MKKIRTEMSKLLNSPVPRGIGLSFSKVSELFSDYSTDEDVKAWGPQLSNSHDTEFVQFTYTKQNKLT